MKKILVVFSKVLNNSIALKQRIILIKSKNYFYRIWIKLSNLDLSNLQNKLFKQDENTNSFTTYPILKEYNLFPILENHAKV